MSQTENVHPISLSAKYHEVMTACTQVEVIITYFGVYIHTNSYFCVSAVKLLAADMSQTDVETK